MADTDRKGTSGEPVIFPPDRTGFKLALGMMLSYHNDDPEMIMVMRDGKEIDRFSKNEILEFLNARRIKSR